MDDDQINFQRAVVAHQQGDFVVARDLYRKVINTCPDHADAFHLCGMAFYQSGEAEQAEDLIRAALTIRPGHRDYHSNLGIVLRARGKTDEAIASLNQALEIDPGFPDALLNLGNAYAASGQTEQAEAAFRRLLDSNPDHAAACNNLAMALMPRKQFGEARELLQHALSVQPDYVSALLNLCRVLIELKCTDEAADRLKLAVQLAGHDSKVLRDAGQMLQGIGENDIAAEIWQRLIAVEPDDAALLVRFGAARQASGLLDEAEQAYQRALTVDEDEYDAFNNLGTVFMARKSIKPALNCFDAAISRKPDFADAIYNRGTALQELGGIIEAEKAYCRAIEMKADFVDAYRSLVDIYRATSRNSAAAEMLQRWLDNVPGDPIATHLSAAIRKDGVPARASDDYVRCEFDRFASDFDKTLAGLEYRAPQAIMEAIAGLPAMPDNGLSILDAGCGTGLCGPLLKPMSNNLVGVDLSPNMIDRAVLRDCYDQLITAELVGYMSGQPGVFDLIVSADTLIYFGDLEAACEMAAAALKPGGHLAFSLEELADATESGFRLNESGRYSHRRDYVERMLRAAGLTVELVTKTVLRQELQQPVHGLIMVARKS